MRPTKNCAHEGYEYYTCVHCVRDSTVEIISDMRNNEKRAQFMCFAKLTLHIKFSLVAHTLRRYSFIVLLFCSSYDMNRHRRYLKKKKILTVRCKRCLATEATQNRKDNCIDAPKPGHWLNPNQFFSMIMPYNS